MPLKQINIGDHAGRVVNTTLLKKQVEIDTG